MNNLSLENGPFNNVSTKSRCFQCVPRCYRCIIRNSIPKFLIPIVLLAGIFLIYLLTKNYIKFILMWIETQNTLFIFGTFIVLFAIVSFPVTVGYLILIITSGYLFGLVKGLITVVLGANIGAAIAHVTIKRLKNKLPIQRLLKNETGKAILRVISGPKAFKVVLLARLTPIPFGVQNTIFGISNVHPKCYYPGTLIGLFPAQAINVYFGSSLRSIHDVLNSHSTAMASYVIFAVQICIGLILMGWILHRARRELTDALILNMDNDFNIIVEVQS